MFEPIWEAEFDEQYDVIVTPKSEHVAVLQIWDSGRLIFSDEVQLNLGGSLGVVADEDVEEWKQIVEDFVDESKIGYN